MQATMQNEKKFKKLKGYVCDSDGKMQPCLIKKSQIAALYEMNLKTLAIQIERNVELKNKLEENGYKPTHKSFSMLQCKLLLQYLGDIFLDL